MLQHAVASDGVTRSMTVMPSMAGTVQTLAGRGGTAAAVARSFREDLSRCVACVDEIGPRPLLQGTQIAKIRSPTQDRRTLRLCMRAKRLLRSAIGE
jgi:hypothetical protein